MPGRALFALIIAGILCATLARFSQAAATVPSYVAFDMDLVITIDSLLMGSQRLPDNVSHPGFGLNLLLTKSQALAHAAGKLSAINLTDLDQALNPLLPAIEMTAFNRAHSPFVALLVVAITWAALAVGLRWQPWLACLGLMTLASQQGLIYQAMGVRSELYALLYWSLGMLAVSMTAQYGGRGRRHVRLLWAIAAGVCLGLAFLTKVQVMFYLLGAGLFLYHLLCQRTQEEPYPYRLGAALSGSALALLLLLLWGAWSVQPARGSGTFATSFALTPPAMAVLGLLVTLTVIHLRYRAGQPFLVLTSAIVLGFILSAGLHLLIFRSLATNWRYLLLDMKIVYLRSDYYGSQTFQTLPAYFDRLLTVASQDPALLGAWLVMLSAALWQLRQEKVRAGLFLALAGTSILGIALGSRTGREQDWIWVEVLPTVVILVGAGQLARTRHKMKRAGVALVLTGLVISNLVLSSSMPARYRQSQATYGYRPWKFSKAVFASSFALYTTPFDHRYQTAGWPAFRASLDQMANLEELLTTAAMVTGHSDAGSLGPAVVGLPVWKASPEWLLTTVTPVLAEGLVIDPPADQPLSLQMRTDLVVFIMLEEERYRALVGTSPTAQGERLELGNGSQVRTLYPLMLSQPREFSRAELGPNPLVLVKPLLDIPNPVLPPDPI